MAKARALVLSIDAMTGEDLAAAGALENFSALKEKCALARNVRSVYPSLTYPCHAAMATGCMPARTKVVNNEVFLPDTLTRPWVFYASQIAVPTIFDAARRAGVSSASVMWPTMGRVGVDTLIPEIWLTSPEADFLEPMCGAGSADYIRSIWGEVGEIARGFEQPRFDEFVTACAERVIRDRAPELLYVHICAVDNAKHYWGPGSKEVSEALSRTDALLGRLLHALDAAGVREETNIVLCSDHGQLPVDTGSWPNRFLKHAGYLGLMPDGSIDWSIECHSACLTAQVYARTRAFEARAREVFFDAAVQKALGIARALTREEARDEHGLAGGFCLVLEAAPGVLFLDDVKGDPLMSPLADAGIRYRANHGHDPRLGDQPFFLIAGPGAKAGASIDAARLIDEPVTVAALMGFDMPWAEGRVLSEMLKEPSMGLSRRF